MHKGLEESAWQPKRLALLGLVALYMGGILILPLWALMARTIRAGFGSAWAALLEPDALHGLLLTVILAVIAVVVNGVFGVVGALVLTRQSFRGRRFLDALVDMPFAVSPVMVGLAFLLLFGREGWLAPLGWKVAFAFPGLVIATVFVTIPFTLREVAHVAEELGTSEEQAAITLGASRWQTFRLVTLPNIRFGLGYGLMLTTARALGEFGAVLVLGGAISGLTQTATTYIFVAMDERREAGAYGMALVLAVISIVLLLILESMKRRRRRRGL
ncbi:MAG: sulfate ABC transporter permease subunit [Planctomycetota bacterium]|nr:MAG: sulfate ABC transporter permease subunit [Planctomycetota bacterium]